MCFFQRPLLSENVVMVTVFRYWQYLGKLTKALKLFIKKTSGSVTHFSFVVIFISAQIYKKKTTTDKQKEQKKTAHRGI